MPVEQRRLPRAWPSRLGFEPELFPDDETLIREVLDGGPSLAGITLERLKAEGFVRLNLPEIFAPFAEGVFPTPSGKCELYSERMKADGLDPLPTYIPPHEDPADAARPGRAIPAATAQPAAAPVPQLDVRQLRPAPHSGRRADDRAVRPRTPSSAASTTASGSRSTTTAASSRPGSP